jgi:hypothetical protein
MFMSYLHIHHLLVPTPTRSKEDARLMPWVSYATPRTDAIAAYAYFSFVQAPRSSSGTREVILFRRNNVRDATLHRLSLQGDTAVNLDLAAETAVAILVVNTWYAE